MIGNSRFHCRGHSQGLLDSPEIIVHEIQGNRVSQAATEIYPEPAVSPDASALTTHEPHVMYALN
jgi:hypothetical protein